MLLSFKVKNFRSFSNEASFSCLSNPSVGEFPDHASPIPDSGEKVLKTSVVYGANGAGKSNLCRALNFLLRMAVSNPVRENRLDYDAFAFSRVEDVPTLFDLQFCTNTRTYRYAVVFRPTGILEERLEWLVSGDARLLFERTHDADGGVVRLSGELLAQATEKLKAQAVVGAANTRTFLSVVCETLPNGSKGAILNDVIAWFSNLLFIGPDASVDDFMAVYRDPEFRSFVSGVLENATGVARLEPVSRRMTPDEMAKMIPDSPIRDQVARLKGQVRVHFGGPNEGEVELIRREGEMDYLATELQAAHRLADGSYGLLKLHQESDGTKRLLNLLPAVYKVVAQGGVCVIDELDRSMHALLSRALVRRFLEMKTRGQLLFTTQEDAILDADFLRRDEIWFAEKDENSSTRLYSLDEYRVRTRKDRRQYYFEGRYGAIPYEWTKGEVAE